MSSINDANQEDWIKACHRLGLDVKNFGKGSHIRVYGGKNQDGPLTIQYKLNNIINRKILKNLKNLGFSEDEITEALK